MPRASALIERIVELFVALLLVIVFGDLLLKLLETALGVH